MSERVRMAVALDAVEEMARRCGVHAGEIAGKATHVQNELTYLGVEEVERFARTFGVDEGELRRQAMRMLHDELRKVLCCYDVRYVKQVERDGEAVGMKVRFHRFRRSA